MNIAGKRALITGATSGMGKATAELFANEGIHLVLCGRRKERLLTLQEQLGQKVDVEILEFDIREREAVFNAVDSLPKEKQQIDILINNAGNAHGLDPIDKGDPDDWDAMIDINVKGLLYITKAVAPGMVQRKNGHIINIGSIAGKEVYPQGNVYSATKHAVDALNTGMRMDLHAHSIRVGAIDPGLVATEFSEVRFKGNKAKADKVYQGYRPLQPEDIADVILFAVTRPPHVNIADLLILPTDQAASKMVHKR